MWGWHRAVHASTQKTNASNIKNHYTNWDTTALAEWQKPLEKLTVSSVEMHQSKKKTTKTENERFENF